MIKSASLMSAAVLVFGLAAGSMTVEVANAAPTADDAGAPAPKASHSHKSHKSSSHKSHKASHKSKKTDGTGK
jgi:hypothetical protein